MAGSFPAAARQQTGIAVLIMCTWLDFSVLLTEYCEVLHYLIN